MLDADDIVACIGKTDDSPEVGKVFATLEVKKRPKIARGDTDARIDLYSQGLSLVFDQDNPRSSKLVLAAAQFYSSEEEGFTMFAGTLPKALLFTDTQKDVRKKLGKPSRTIKALSKDLWDSGSVSVSVEYSDKTGRVKMVAYDRPMQD